MHLRTKYTQRLPTASGLRLDIPMFEGSGSKVLDVSGKGNHGTITDAVWTRDENGVAMTFNGTSAYIDCGNDASLNITDAITIEAWVKRDVDNAYHTIYTRGYAAPPDNYIWATIMSNNYPHFRIVNGGATYDLTASQTITAADGWTHLVFWWDGETIKIAINGEFDANTKSFTNTIAYDVTTTWIGQRAGLYFNGTIGEVRIYAVAPTAEQIKRRYEQTKRDYVRGS